MLSTLTLTTGIDTFTGTAGNDTIIGDNSGASATVTAGDQVNGGTGVDTFKYYVGTAQAIDALVLPQISGVENLYVKSGVFTDTKTLDVSAISGLTTVELDSPAALADASNFTIKTAAGQAVALDNVNTVTTKAATVTLTNATAVTVNGVGGSSTNNGTVKIDLGNTTATAASLAATGAASKVTLLNTPGKVATLTITGDQNLTLTEALTTLKTITASAATGKISVDTTGINGVDATLDAAFAFTGGSGNDTLKLVQGSLDALTAGSQLDAGTGTDTLFVTANNKVAADLTFATADYKAINAAKGFDVLAISAGAAKTATVDASLLTSIKEFAVSNDTNVISKVAAGSTLDINGATTKTTVSGAVGTSDLTINIGSATATAGTANTALDITGLTNITINANIKAGTVGATHSLGTLTQSDNSTFTIKGNGDLTLALGSASVTGSKIDGSAATGILTLTGNTAALDGTKASLGDILIGGSGNDVITSGLNSSSLTGNGGKDSFVVKAVVGASTPVTTVTDFTKGDTLTVAATGATLLKVDLSGQAAGKTDAQIFTALAAADVAVGNVAWGVYNGNTYVFDEVATAGAVNATDIAVKLVGALDLSTSTIATGVITFA